MPGADARSAAQEPWHRHTLKEAFVGYEHKGPYAVAQKLQTGIVDPLLPELRNMNRGSVN